MWRPREEDEDDSNVDHRPKHEDGHAAQDVTGSAECEAEHGIADGVGEQDEANVLHAIGTRDVTLLTEALVGLG